MNKYIEIAYNEAKKCKNTDDVPVGAVIVENDEIISFAHNTREKDKKITGHAEINAVEKACNKKQTWHLDNCIMYVTLEPCKMCMEVIKQSRIKKVYYATSKTKEINNVKLEIKKIDDNGKSSSLLTHFFKNKRNNNNS